MDAYEQLRRRPSGRTVMRQSWRDLLFLHFSVEPEIVQKSLPVGLAVDTFPDASGEEKAWIGLVPFRMLGIRPTWAPAMPWVSAFPETNVRTYVHREGREPGVWFYSLDAARWIATRVARSSFQLAYFHARMSCRREGDRLTYESTRLEAPAAKLRIEAEVGEELAAPEPGSFEFFLVERYLLYARRNGTLFKGQVFHRPYPLRSAEVRVCEQDLTDSHGFSCERWEHAIFSDGVDVEVFPLEKA